MFRLSWLTAITVFASAIAHGDERTTDLAEIDRNIHTEPAYNAEPHYALLVLGPRAEHRAWFVLDGDDVAYIDRNGNGDLTEPGERIELDRAATGKINLASSSSVKAMHVFQIGEVAGSKLNFKLWVRNPNYSPLKDKALDDQPKIRAYRQDLRDRGWVNGSLYRVAADGMHAQIPLLLTTKPIDAQVCQLLGSLTIKLKWGESQRLEPWPKRTVFDINIGSRNLPPRGWTHGGFDFAPLTTSEVPEDIHPVAIFEYPVSGPDGEPLRQVLEIDQRCCGDTCLATLMLPKGVTSGTVKVTVTYLDWPGHNVESRQFNVSVNEELSRFGESAYVMFHDPQIKLKDAVNVLRKSKLEVMLEKDSLWVMKDGEPSVLVRLNRDPEAHQVAVELAEGTKFAERLRRCDARFGIAPYDADKAETIRQIRQALQQLTQGFVYQTWDQQLSAPK